MLTKRQSDLGCLLLTLPGELRMNIYSALFTHDEPIEIRRSPAILHCKQNQRSFIVDGRGDTHGNLPHPECQSRINEWKASDLYSIFDVTTHSEHYPCPRSIAGYDLNLDLLLTCRQIYFYFEARKLPYALNTFLVKELGIFSNFCYCLKRWQIRAITQLAFDIPMEGITVNVGEWNDIFSLMAASFSCLERISGHMQLEVPRDTLRDSFWNGGLLELDRLRLKEVKATILEEDMQPHFTYSTNRSQDQWLPFQDCRDRLYPDRGYDRKDDLDLYISYRYTSNPCPLYIRNLIYLMAGRDQSHVTLLPESFDQRNYPAYRFDYGLSDTTKRTIFGYDS